MGRLRLGQVGKLPTSGVGDGVEVYRGNRSGTGSSGLPCNVLLSSPSPVGE